VFLVALILASGLVPSGEAGFPIAEVEVAEESRSFAEGQGADMDDCGGGDFIASCVGDTDISASLPFAVDADSLSSAIPPKSFSIRFSLFSKTSI
jgi:hypothetical protein